MFGAKFLNFQMIFLKLLKHLNSWTNRDVYFSNVFCMMMLVYMNSCKVGKYNSSDQCASSCAFSRNCDQQWKIHIRHTWTVSLQYVIACATSVNWPKPSCSYICHMNMVALVYVCWLYAGAANSWKRSSENNVSMSSQFSEVSQFLYG